MFCAHTYLPQWGLFRDGRVLLILSIDCHPEPARALGCSRNENPSREGQSFVLGASGSTRIGMDYVGPDAHVWAARAQLGNPAEWDCEKGKSTRSCSVAPPYHWFGCENALELRV